MNESQETLTGGYRLTTVRGHGAVSLILFTPIGESLREVLPDFFCADSVGAGHADV
jgi:hypothetical protein